MTALRQVHLNRRSILTNGSQVSHTLAAQRAHHVAVCQTTKEHRPQNRHQAKVLDVFLSVMNESDVLGRTMCFTLRCPSPELWRWSSAKSAVCIRARCLHSLTVCQSTEMSKRNSGWISNWVNPAVISLAPPWGWREQLWPAYCSDYGNNLTASECRRRLETMTCILVREKCCSCWISSWWPQPKTTCVGALLARPQFKTHLDWTSVPSIKIILSLVLNLQEVGGLKVCE